MTAQEHRLEAPHRRRKAGPRVVERAAVTGYKATSWLLGVLPPGPARVVIGGFSQVSYLVWPAKRRWSNENFGHVMGLPPDDPRVRRMALRAYHEYGRYLVELMRLPSMPPETVGVLATRLDAAEIKRIGAPVMGTTLLVALAILAKSSGSIWLRAKPPALTAALKRQQTTLLVRRPPNLTAAPPS